MSELTARLSKYGADIPGALERFVGDEELYGECFGMFLEDSAFQSLGDAIQMKDYAAAFDAAHTLKGVAGNLGLTPLYNAVCDIVEPLRHRDYSNLEAEYQAVMNAKKVLETLKQDAL